MDENDKVTANMVNTNNSSVFYGSLKKKYKSVDYANGVFVYDTEGNRYIDCAAGVAVSNIGHGVKEVLDAIYEQGQHATYVYGSTFTSEIREELASRLISIAPHGMKRVFFCSGGSEAVESMAKIARQYQVEEGRPGKYKIISRWQSYHGNTIATLSLGGRPSWRKYYEPMLLHMPHIAQCNCYRCPYGLKYPQCNLTCAHELERVIKYEGADTVAAFLLEPIIGTTATATVPPDGYLQTIREICDKYNVLLCCDEVITGLGRTGKNFAVDHFNVVPDLISVAKGLGGGYVPIGAVIAHEKVIKAIDQGSGALEHSYTFGSMPLVCAGANAVLKYVLDNELIKRAEVMGKVFLKKLKSSLADNPIVGEVRGIGMLIGVEIVQDKQSKKPFPQGLNISGKIADYCFSHGVLLLSGVTGTSDGIEGEALQISPPLIMEEAEMNIVASVLSDAFNSVLLAAE